MRTYSHLFLVLLCIFLFGIVPAFSQEKDEPKKQVAVREDFLISWPDEEGWAAANVQENDKMHFVEVLRKGETFDNWSQLGTMIAYKNLHVPDISMFSKMYSDTYRKKCPDVRLIIHSVEQDREYPRIIFSLDCPKFLYDGKAESGVWMATQGKTSLYLVFRSIKSDTVPEKLRSEWIEQFKTGRVIVK